MPIPARLRLFFGRNCWPALLLVVLGVAACQPQRPPVDTAAPPVGHYQGSIGAAGSPQLKASLDIRHPSEGHYDAELTVPGAPAISFVADTLLLTGDQLRLVRPARPGQTLALKLEGDFWRGTLSLDSTSVPLILLKRGVPDPSSYRVAAVPQPAGGPSWLFAPTDTGTPGAALALLPDAATAPTAALWADALARAGIVVLLLPPPADTATAATEAPRLLAALRRLRATPGVDTASVGAWAAGNRATALAAALPRLAFFIVQNAVVDVANRPAFRELRNRKVSVLGLFGGADAVPRAALLRAAVGSRRGNLVRSYRTAGPGLLTGEGLNVQFGPGLPDEVGEWVRSR